MSQLKIPAGKIVATAERFNRKELTSILEKVPESGFTGYLTVSGGGRTLLLLLFHSSPYFAALHDGEQFRTLTITDFCTQVAAAPDNSGIITLHATDPVLLKSLLVLMQEEPAARGPVSLINLEGMIRKIKGENADALVVLELEGGYSFFFFLGGTKTAAYWSDSRPEGAEQLTVDEQLLLAAYSKSDIPVNLLIYQNLATNPARDSSNLSVAGMVRLFSSLDGAVERAELLDTEPLKDDQLCFRVLEGLQAGQQLRGPIPSLLGRKDADIIISDPMVSRRHAAIQLVNGQLMLMDLHSTNGTTLNGNSITRHQLEPGDRIGIGATILLLEQINL